MSKGLSHSLIDPDTLHPVTWTVFHPSDGANCTIRLLQTNLTYITLDTVNTKADPNGWFPCARKEAKYETVTAVIPKDPKCTDCALQIIFKTYQGNIFQCSDVQITALPTQTCKGKCKNGGICDSNMCECKDNYYGTYCENKVEKEESSSSIGIFFLFLLLLIIASILLAVLYYWKNPEKMPKPALGVIQRFFPAQEEENNGENPEEKYEDKESRVKREGLAIEVKGRKDFS